MTTDETYLSKTKLALRFGVTTRSIDNWVKAGRLAAPHRLPNGRPAWPASVVEAAAKPASAV